MATKRDFYDVLGVGKKASLAEIKRAYRKQALAWHPDRNKSAEAETKFKEINEAYEILSNPKKKETYDQFGHAAFSQGGLGTEGPYGGGSRIYRQGPFTYTYSTSGGSPFEGGDFGGFSDPFEIFEAFFGGGGQFRQRQQLTRYSMTLTFLEAAKGVEKTIIHKGSQRTIKIPAGVNDGSRIKFGDFFVTIDVLADKTFQREDDDVIVSQPIEVTLAALGGTTTVPTLDGDLKLKIRAGTQPGTIVRLRGRGIKHLHGYGSGDLYIRLMIEVPKNLTHEQREILERLQETLD